MEFMDAVKARRTARTFTGAAVPEETILRMLEAGMAAPTNDHLRNWEFVLLHTAEEKENGLKAVRDWAEEHAGMRREVPDAAAQVMYDHALPRQYTMLNDADWVILPFFKCSDQIFEPGIINRLNPFASIWCVVENILLAAADAGLGCSLRIPMGDEWRKTAAQVNAPEGWILPCYIGVGVPDGQLSETQHTYTAAEKTHRGTWQ